MAVEGLVAYCVPSGIPALGYSWHRNGIVEKTIRVRGEVVKREFLRPPKKMRRRIGRGLRRGK